MPVLNSRGNALAGIDGIVSIDGVPVSALLGITAGGWRWISDDVIGGQAFINDAWTLWKVNRPSEHGELSALDNTMGANDFRAGGDQYLAYTVPPPYVRGTITKATGYGRALYDVGRDGVAAVKDDQTAERGVSIAINGTTLAPYPDDVFIAYQDGYLLSVAPAGLTLTSIATWTHTGIPDLGVRGGRICAAPGGQVYQVFYWLGYTVVQALGTYMGWVVRFSEHDFNPDVVAIDATTLIVATSYGQGERPEQTQKYTINLAVAPIDLRTLQPPIILPPVEDVALIHRAAFIGPYQFNTFGTQGIVRRR
jgi:hypothetical protein